MAMILSLVLTIGLLAPSQGPIFPDSHAATPIVQQSPSTDRPQPSSVEFVSGIGGAPDGSSGRPAKQAPVASREVVDRAPVGHYAGTITGTVSPLSSTASLAGPSDIVSDDFSSSTLNSSLWTTFDPVGDASFTMTGTQLAISIGAGAAHDPWTGGDTAARITQPSSNTDFEIEAKFESALTSYIQGQGILVEETQGKYLRFDVFGTGTAVRAYSALIDGGVAATELNQPVSLGAPMWLRVTRSGDTWTYRTSPDGSTWTVQTTFTQPLTVTAVGVFAANFPDGSAPAHTALVDYFFNTASPIVPEDGGATNPPPTIDIWYGDTQSFGALGTPQRWVDILGNAVDADGVASLSYTLNGGPAQTLSMGPDTRRLNLPGDFDVQIATADLVPGSNTVTIEAVDTQGATSTKTVTVNWQSGNSWPLPYSIDWSTTTNIQDVAQVVDGKWDVTAQGAHSIEPGYDRLVDIGDVGWTDYEVTVPITLVGLDVPRGYQPPSYGPALGLVLRWDGHYDWDGSQPAWGWWPLGAIAQYRWTDTYERFQLRGNEGSIEDEDFSGATFAIGDTWIYKVRVETNATGGYYSFKYWKQGQPEPAAWKLTAQQTLSDPQNGSLLLLAHHADAIFGNVTITPVGAGDVMPPVVSGVGVVPGVSSAVVSWVTDEVSSSVVRFGTSVSYGSVVSDAGLVTSHSVGLSGLSASTLYHYQVESTDGSGNTATSGDYTFTTDPAVGGSGIVSDDFFGSVLDTSLWSMVNPVGDGSFVMTGTQLALSAGAGPSHDPWSSGDTAVRVMQSANDTDFEIEVKFESDVTLAYQGQGLLVEESPGRFLRFDVFSDGRSVHVYSALIDGSSATKKVNVKVSLVAPMWLRVTRSGDTWTYATSSDGVSWTVRVSFAQPLVVSAVGVFAGNFSSSGSSAPEHTALVDYFFNTASPIIPEDG